MNEHPTCFGFVEGRHDGLHKSGNEGTAHGMTTLFTRRPDRFCSPWAYKYRPGRPYNVVCTNSLVQWNILGHKKPDTAALHAVQLS